MKNLTTFRDTGSLIAGLLIGVAIVVPVFAMTTADLGNTETAWVIVGPILVLAAGVVIQAAVTRPRQRRTNDPRLLAVSRLAMTAFAGPASISAVDISRARPAHPGGPTNARGSS